MSALSFEQQFMRETRRGAAFDLACALPTCSFEQTTRRKDSTAQFSVRLIGFSPCEIFFRHRLPKPNITAAQTNQISIEFAPSDQRKKKRRSCVIMLFFLRAHFYDVKSILSRMPLV
ncbi:hypothetical protein F2P81_005358 [Scophthalmus maximus]|uniref:Uncharacterized protein n=1 Tax=Scophthalmus maximus TaxID=52904 RepID=A0A6A4T2X3_SCOMX|nr:hypothetical protein F2P81_005358 [Scophthalmus maximus]